MLENLLRAAFAFSTMSQLPLGMPWIPTIWTGIGITTLSNFSFFYDSPL
jgi:hypothetical protein